LKTTSIDDNKLYLGGVQKHVLLSVFLIFHSTV